MNAWLSAAFCAVFVGFLSHAQAQERPAKPPALPRANAATPMKPATGASPSGRAEPARQAGPLAPSRPIAANASPPQPAMGRAQALYLIRTSLLTLNDANKSGNYTVLRDLAAPGFRDANTSADLAGVFDDLRRRRFDLFGVALLEPQLTAEPSIRDDGRLRLTGRFDTRPLLIAFDMLFEIVDGQWRLFGLSVQTPPAEQPNPMASGISPAMDRVPPPLSSTPEWAPPR